MLWNAVGCYVMPCGSTLTMLAKLAKLAMLALLCSAMQCNAMMYYDMLRHPWQDKLLYAGVLCLLCLMVCDAVICHAMLWFAELSGNPYPLTGYSCKHAEGKHKMAWYGTAFHTFLRQHNFERQQ